MEYWLVVPIVAVIGDKEKQVTIDQQILEALTQRLPLHITEVSLKDPVGLVIVDEVNGFCTPGAGALAPPTPDPSINRMVVKTLELATMFHLSCWPILVFRDEHDPGQIEPPYPPHCQRGTGEELLVPTLSWLNESRGVTIMPKNCINGFVGGIQPDNRNLVVDWVNQNKLKAIVVVGICTDICDMDFVVTMLSARNHGMMPTLEDVVVYVPGCSTYNLPKEIALSIKLPESAAHPADITHYMGLYFMASRGALLASRLNY